MISTYAPQIFLFLAVITCWIPKARWFGAALGAAVADAWWHGQVTWAGLLGCIAVFVLARAAGLEPFFTYRGKAYVLALTGVAILLSDHRWPGFRNVRVFDHIQFTPDAVPFTMYFNLDKTCVGLALARFLLLVQRRGGAFVRAAAVGWALSVAVLLPLALISHYVQFDPKWPAEGWIWAVNNFVFVCFAEEALHRGLIQQTLAERWPKRTWIAIAVGAITFGGMHYAGGIWYVAFAALAGLVYGWVYQKTGRLEASMLTHFGLNATHLLLFTYPSLAPAV